MPNVALIAGNLVSDSGVEVSAINAQNYARKHSARDFPNGTLIETTIDYSVTNGDPFVLEITGNSYGSLIPFNLAYQGYIYNNTTINHGGISIGAAISGMSLFNYNGKLCFWFPSQGYWQGFNVYVYIADTGFRENKVTNITNVAKPAGITKEISMTFQQVIRASSASVGTTNYVAKFTGNVAVGDSQIIDNGTDIGIGVVPLATTLGKSLSIGSAGNGLLSYDVGNTYLTQNTYYNGAWKYANNAPASQYILFSGEHLFFTAPSGTAGTNVTLTERMRITSSGNVGIGTTTPATKLDVNGIIRVSTTDQSTNRFRLFNQNSGQTWDIIGGLNGANNTDFSIYDGSNTRFVITSSGNVGIGTTSPNVKLEVSGLVRVTGTNGFSLGADAGQNRIQYSTSTFSRFALLSSGDSYTGLTAKELSIGATYGGIAPPSSGVIIEGNVGIGTTSITARLDVVSNVAAIDQFRVGQDAVHKLLIGSETNYAEIQAIRLGIDFNKNLVLQRQGGNVGIGTTSPSTRLHVSGGNIFVDNANGSVIVRNGDTTNQQQIRLRMSGNDGILDVTRNSGTTPNLIFGTEATERMRIDSSGNIAIGVTSADSTSLRIVPTSTDTVQRVLHIGYNGSMTTGTHGSLITFGNTTPSTAQLARIGAFYEGSTYMGSLRFYTNADTEGTNPSERMRITAAGNVGIGATNPGSMINSGAFFKPETAGEHLDILSSSNEAVINLRSNRDTNGGQVGGIYFTRDSGQSDAHRHIGAIQVRQKNTGTLAGGEMLFFTKTSNSGVGVDAARMIIDTSGGITLSSLAGTGTRIVTADPNGFLAASALSSSVITGSGTTNYVARWTSSSALGTGVLFDNGSFVGVGITSNFAGGPRLYVSKTTASEEIFRVDGQGGAGCLIISNTASSVQTAFYNGNVGVGTFSPQQKFVVSNVGAEGLEFIPAPSVNSNQIQSYNRSTSSWNSLILRASEYNVQIGTTATLYINGSGNVGIGTTTPNTKLDVVATKNTTGLRLSPSAASAANDYTQIGVGNPGADVDYASIRFTYENGLSNWYNTAISFHTFARFPGNALLERMRINGDGYVGIATSNPLNFLDVYSNNRTSLTAIGGGINVNYTGNTTGQFSTIGFSWAQSIDGATRWGMGLTGTSFASGLADLFFFNGGVERMRITSAGNIGIGTTSGITGKLTISSSLGDQIKLDRTGQTSRGIVISAADNLSIGTWVDPTQVSITPSGNVGIGTASPTQKLEVHGDILIENGADSVSKLIISNGGGGNAEIIGSEADGILRIKNGNSGVPIIHFLNSGDSVMMAINNSNVGIGTTTPQAILETYKSAGTTDFVGLRMHNYDASSRNTSSTSVSFFVGATQERARITAGNPDDFSGANGFLTFSTRTSEAVTEKMRITSGGNVGIGTTSPSIYSGWTGVDIRGTNGGHLIVGNTAATNRGEVFTDGNGFNVSAQTNNALILKTNDTERVRITAAGNVGIGTISPGAILDVYSPGYNFIRSTGGNGGYFESYNSVGTRLASFGAESGGDTYVVSRTNSPMMFLTNNNERIRITAAGDIGLGASAPFYRVHISQPKNTTGLFISNSPSTADDYTQIGFGFDTYNVACVAVRAIAENPAGSFNHHLAFHTYNTTLQERMRITSTGNVGIGLTSPPSRLSIATGDFTSVQAANSDVPLFLRMSAGSSATTRNTFVSQIYTASNTDQSNHQLLFISGNNTTFISGSLAYTTDGAFAFRTAGGNVAANTLTGTERMRIDANGNVRIGVFATTLNQTGILFSPGNASIFSSTSNGLIDLRSNRAAVAADIGGTISFGAVYRNTDSDSTNIATINGFRENATTNNWSSYISFQTTNVNVLSEKVRITSEGNVGIGTTSPNAKLEVRDGDISVSTFNTFSYFNANRLTVLSGVGQILGGLRFQAYSTGTTLVTGAQILAYSNEAWTSSTAATYLSFHTTQSGSVTATERMRIFPNGRIGINTTTDAGYQLDVNGGTRVTGRITVTGNDTLGLSVVRAGTSAISSEIYNSGGDNSWMLWGVESSVGGVIFPGSTAYAAVIGQFRNTPLEFFTNNTIRGSFSGAGAFRVHNLAGTGTRVVVADANGVLSTSASAAVTGSGTTNYIPKFTAAGVIGDSQIFDNGTNVGIGTASPSFRLDVQSAASTIVRIKGGTGAAQGSAYYQTFAGSTNTMSAFGDRANIFGGTVDQIASIYTGANIPLTFDINATERMRITAGGRVGIGTASPNYFVEAYQNGLSDVIVNSAADNNSAYVSVFNTGGTSGNFAQLRAYGNTTGSTLFGSSTNKMITLFSNGDSVFTMGTISSTPLVLGTANAERMRIFGNGRVGINTTTDAGYQLDVNGSFRASGVIRSGAAVGVTTGFFQLDHPGAQTWKIGVFSDNTSTFSIGNDLAGTFASRYLNITNAGNVGIGTTSPAAKLDIAYSTNPTTATPHILLTTGGTAKQAAITAEAFAVGGLVFSTGDGTLVDRMTILRTNGNVGIGTTAPSTKLHVVGQTYITDDLLIRGTHNPYASSGRGVVALNGTAGNIISFASSTTTHGYMFVTNAQYEFVTVANQNFLFYNGSTEALRITNAGNVGIGTTSPAQRLDVSGVIRANSGTIYAQASGTESSGYQLNAITMGYDAAANIGWVTAGGAAARTNLVLQQSGGNVLIGTATSSGYRLQVSGSIYGSAGIDITQSFFSSGTAAGVYINGTTNGASIQALSQSLTGSNASALFSGGTTWNTTGSPSLIDILVTNTASGASSNFIKISDSTNTFRVTKDAGLITSNPTGGTAKKWKLGSVVSTTVTMVTSQYVEVEIDGTFYRLALVTPA